MKRSPKKFYAIISIVLIAILSFAVLHYFQLDFWLSVFAAMNMAAFFLFGFDKWQAIQEGGRVPEIVLFALFLAGGFAGGAAGMFVFLHKINKWQFWAVALSSFLIYMQLYAWYFGRPELLLPMFK